MRRKASASTHQSLKFDLLYSQAEGGELNRLSRQFERFAGELPARLEDLEERFGATPSEISEMKVLEWEGWSKREELDDKLARLAELVGELECEAADTPEVIPAVVVSSQVVTPGALPQS